MRLAVAAGLLLALLAISLGGVLLLGGRGAGPTPSTTTQIMSTTTTTTMSTAGSGGEPQKAEGLVEALNMFSIEMYRLLYVEGEDPGNTVFSPFSIYSALLIAYEGMGGETREEAGEALRLPGDEVLEGYTALLEHMLSTRGNASVRVANALWADNMFPLNEDYVERVRSLYGAEARNLDFAGDPEGSRRLINSWVENMTNGRIKNLLPPGSITGKTVVVITNAVHFKAPWLEPFTEVFRDKFLLENGGAVEAEMMSGKMWIQRYEDEDLLAVAIPYKGTNITMVILMPKKGLSSYEEHLSWVGVKGVLEKLFSPENRAYVLLTMPKFKVSTPTITLREELMDMGMKLAFTPQADFTPMSPAGRGVYIDNVYHKAYIEVNRWGTEAAAATAIVVLESLPPEVRIDRPFIFMLYDRSTGTILFVGRLVNPAQSSG